MDKLVKVDSTQLEEVVKNSGLAIQEGEEIKQSYIPFLVQLAEIQDQASKINFEKPASIDETIARELRLKTVKVRTGAADLKESRKRIHLLKGNLEQAAYNLIAASCKLAEETFVTVEKAREIAEAKRQAELKTVRDPEILPFIEFVPAGLDMGKITEEDYQKLLSGAKMQMDAKIEAEKKAEAERIAKEKAVKLNESRKNEILPYWNFIPAEYRDIDFSTLTDEEWKERFEFSKSAKLADDDKRAKIEAENERLKKEADEKENRNKIRNAELKPFIMFIRDYEKMLNLEESEYKKELADVKIGAEQHWALEREKTQKEAKDKADLQAKVDAADKAAKDKADKEAADLKLKQDAEKKAAAAPDKDKLLALAIQISTMKLPELKTAEAKAILANVETLIAKTAAYINEKSATL